MLTIFLSARDDGSGAVCLNLNIDDLIDPYLTTRVWTVVTSSFPGVIYVFSVYYRRYVYKQNPLFLSLRTNIPV